jgi:hypothetical protein
MASDVVTFLAAGGCAGMSSVIRTGHRFSARRGHRCRAWGQLRRGGPGGRPALDLAGQARLRRLRLPPRAQPDQLG